MDSDCDYYDSRFQLGEIVISNAGRDAGKHFIIIDNVDENHVKIADGKIRQISSPKLKNVKHLESTGIVFKELAYWLSNKKRVRDSDLYKFITACEEQYKEAK